MTHQRRSNGNAGTTVAFTGDTPVILKKDQFLANRQNKQRFIIMLSEEFTKKNCETHDATGDADLLIVQNAMQSATSCNNVLVAEPGRSTLNVLNYKYKYFPPRKYLITSTFLFGEMYLSTFRVLSKCT